MKKIFTIIAFIWLGFTAYSQSSCSAGFVFAANPNGTVAFYDSSFSIGQIVSSTWQFGDGTAGTGLNVTHTYNGFGPYYVCHTIYGSDSCHSTFCDTVMIGGCNLYLGISQYPDTTNNSMYLYAYAQGGTAPYMYSWGPNPATTQSISVYHTGNYCVTVTDATGCSNHVCASVTFPDTTVTCSSYFHVDTNLLNCGPYCIGFNGFSSVNNVTSWTWSFGDGSSATGQNPVHSFAGPGSYAVCLTTATSNGCSSTYCHDVIIPGNNPCNGFVAVTTQYLDSLNNVNIYAYAQGGTAPLSYIWNNGVSGFTVLANYPGTYCVTVTDGNGCVASSCQTIGTDTVTCNGFYVVTTQYPDSLNGFYIAAQSHGGYAPYTYAWSDGSATQYISASASGSYCVTVVDSHGCVSSSCENVYSDTPVDSVYTTPFDTCIVIVNSYIDTLVVLDSNNVVVTWVLVDQNGSVISYSANYQYGQTGTIVVYLTISCSNGKSITTIHDVINVTYDMIMNIDAKVAETVQASLFPNPVKDNLNIVIDAQSESRTSVQILNSIGQMVYSHSQNIERGEHHLMVNTEKFSSGMYFILINSDGNKPFTKKFIK